MTILFLAVRPRSGTGASSPLSHVLVWFFGTVAGGTFLFLVGCSGAAGVTASGTSSRIGVLALSEPAGRVIVLKRSVEGEDCPGGGAYGDYGTAIRNAIASVRGANVLVNVTLSSAESLSILGVGICTRATGDAGRLE